MEKIVISKISADEFIRLECLKMAVSIIDARVMSARMLNADDQNPLRTLENCANDLCAYVHSGYMSAPPAPPPHYRMEEVKDEDVQGET